MRGKKRKERNVVVALMGNLFVERMQVGWSYCDQSVTKFQRGIASYCLNSLEYMYIRACNIREPFAYAPCQGIIQICTRHVCSGPFEKPSPIPNLNNAFQFPSISILWIFLWPRALGDIVKFSGVVSYFSSSLC